MRTIQNQVGAVPSWAASSHPGCKSAAPVHVQALLDGLVLSQVRSWSCNLSLSTPPGTGITDAQV